MDHKQGLIILNLIISLCLVGIILHFVGIREVVNEISSVNIFYLFLALISLFLMDIVMSYRIGLLLEELGIHLSFLAILKSHFVGMLLADFTPSRTGYFATAAVLRYNYEVPSEKALLSIFGPQIFDFAFKLVAGSLAMFYVLFVFIGSDKGWILIGGAFVLAIIIGLMLLVLFSKSFLKMFSFIDGLPLLSKFYNVIVRMQENSHVVVKKTPHLLLLIFLSWFFRSISWYLVAKSVGITLQLGFPEPVFYFFLQPLVTMLEFVPSPTIAGLGLSEGGTTLVFSLFGVLPAKATLFALLARFKTTFLHLSAVPEALAVPKAIKL